MAARVGSDGLVVLADPWEVVAREGVSAAATGGGLAKLVTFDGLGRSAADGNFFRSQDVLFWAGAL